MSEPEKAALVEQIVALKQKKSRCKAVYTRMSNRLIDYSKESDTTLDDMKECRDKLEEAIDKYRESIESLIECLSANKQTEELLKVSDEMEKIDEKYESAMKSYQEKQNELSQVKSDAGEGEEMPL